MTAPHTEFMPAHDAAGSFGAGAEFAFATASMICSNNSGDGSMVPLHLGYFVQPRKYRPPNRDFCSRIPDPHSGHCAVTSICGPAAFGFFSGGGGMMSLSFYRSSALIDFAFRQPG